MAKEHVISFRVSDEQFEALKKRYETDLPQGMGEVKTPNKMARKILSDVLAGRAVYVNETDRTVDWDFFGQSVTAKPAVAAKPAAAVRSLRKK